MSNRGPMQEPPPGSWKEVWDLTVMVMGILAVPTIAVLLGITLIMWALWAALNAPLMAAVPVGIMVGGLWYMAQRDKKARAALEAEIAETTRKV